MVGFLSAALDQAALQLCLRGEGLFPPNQFANMTPSGAAVAMRKVAAGFGIQLVHELLHQCRRVPTQSTRRYHLSHVVRSPFINLRLPHALGSCRTMAVKKGKKKKGNSLEDALNQVEAMYGKGSIMQLGSKEVLNVETVSSGSLTLDLALGVGGFPKGRIVEIYGGESSGKTTLALHAIAQVQNQGGNCCFIDVEHALDPRYARDVGVDIDSLYIAQPDAGEQALEIADIMVRSGSMDLVVVDSVAALVPRAEAEGEMGDSHIALQVREPCWECPRI